MSATIMLAKDSLGQIIHIEDVLKPKSEIFLRRLWDGRHCSKIRCTKKGLAFQAFTICRYFKVSRQGASRFCCANPDAKFKD